MPDDTPSTWRSLLLASMAPAAAIAVFGVLFGAAARPLLGTWLTLASSLFIFSGALQFAIVGLLAAGATAPALLLTAGTLNLRHVVMAAILRPHVGGSRVRRAGLAFVLIDESFGLALAARRDAERALLVTGMVFYLSWLLGTLLGVLGAGIAGVAGLADAIFPVLFIGLAAVAATSRTLVVRAIAAGVLTLGVALLWPGMASLAPVLVALVVALPRERGEPKRPEPSEWVEAGRGMP